MRKNGTRHQWLGLVSLLAVFGVIAHAQSANVGTPSQVNLKNIGIPTYTSSEGTVTGDFPDGHLAVSYDGTTETNQIIWAENQSWGSYGTSVPFAANSYQALGVQPVYGAWGSAATSSGDRSHPTYFDNSGSWLMSVFRVEQGTFTLDPNSNYMIGFYHGEDHWFTDAGTSNSYYHDPIAWIGVGLATSPDGGNTWYKQGMILGVPDLKPNYPSPFTASNPNAPWGGIGNQCTVLDSHSNPSQPAWVTFFPMINLWNATNPGYNAGHGITAAMSTDPNASRASWYAYAYDNFTTVKQQTNEANDESLPGLDGDAGSDYDHYSLSNPSVHWNTALNTWVLVSATWDRSKMLISYSTTGTVSGPWSKPTLLYSAPTGTTITYPTIVGTDHLGHLNDTESGAEATLYWAQFDSAGVRSMQSAPVSFGFGLADTTSLVSSVNPSVEGQSVTLTATVNPTSGTATPTGTINFMDGTTSLSTVALKADGTAQLITSTLSATTHSITAQYSGDGNYLGTTSNTVTEVITAPIIPSYTVGLSAQSLTIKQSSQGSTTLSITPTGGFNSAISLSSSGLPANTTLSFANSTVTPDGSNSVIAVNATITTNTTVTDGNNAHAQRMRFWPLVEGLALSCCLPFAFGRRRKKLHGMIAAGILAICFSVVMGASSCSGSTSNSSPVTPIGTSTVTVTAKSGSISQSATFSLTIQ